MVDFIYYDGKWPNLCDELLDYKEEIEEVVNNNVPWGCCSSCI